MPSRFLTLWSMLAKPGQQHQQPISDKKKKNKKDTSATQVNKTPKLFLATFDILWRPTLPTGVKMFLRPLSPNNGREIFSSSWG